MNKVESNFQLIITLINYIEQYQRGREDTGLVDFVLWLNNQLFVRQSSEMNDAHKDLSIAFEILYLNQELKKQTKSILSNVHLKSIDEYSFLLHLNHQESFRKMEIIELHNLEAPTGIEIIKRLLKNQLVMEFPDPDDGRAKRISITKLGINELQIVQPQMTKIFGELTEILGLDEKIQLSGILNKLITNFK